MKQDENRLDFGRRVETLMIARGMTQSELARKANARMPADKAIRRDSINVYIHGKAMPGPLRLRALAEALDVDVRELLPSADIAPPTGNRMTLETLADGKVLIVMEKKVTMSTAAEIMRLIQNDEKGVR